MFMFPVFDYHFVFPSFPPVIFSIPHFSFSSVEDFLQSLDALASSRLYFRGSLCLLAYFYLLSPHFTGVGDWDPLWNDVYRGRQQGGKSWYLHKPDWPDLKGKQFKEYGSYRGGFPAMEVQIIFHCWAFSFL